MLNVVAPGFYRRKCKAAAFAALQLHAGGAHARQSPHVKLKMQRCLRHWRSVAARGVAKAWPARLIRRLALKMAQTRLFDAFASWRRVCRHHTQLATFAAGVAERLSNACSRRAWAKWRLVMERRVLGRHAGQSAERQKLAMTLMRFKQKMGTAEARRQRLLDEKKELQKKQLDLEAQIERCKIDSASVQRTLEKMENRKRQIDHEIAEVASTKAFRKSELEEIEGKLERIDAQLQSKENELTNRHGNVQTQLNSMHNGITQLETNLRDLEENSKRMQAKAQQSRDQALTRVEAAKDVAADVEESITAMTSKRADQETDLQELRKAVDDLEVELDTPLPDPSLVYLKPRFGLKDPREVSTMLSDISNASFRTDPQQSIRYLGRLDFSDGSRSPSGRPSATPSDPQSLIWDSRERRKMLAEESVLEQRIAAVRSRVREAHAMRQQKQERARELREFLDYLTTDAEEKIVKRHVAHLKEYQ
uniref:Uncharacterized protein n=1 Tax=Pinguiococcus pyrenoidosus TaxID=172671 RepID=A0A7R9YAY5_9STRA